MKTKHFAFCFLLFAFICTVFSCAKIDELNDYNTVVSFSITEHKAADGGIITLGETTTKGEEIHIDVLYGIHNFPLMFKGTPNFANSIDRVTGLDFSDWITIDLIRDADGEPVMVDGNYTFEEPKFYVQAVSGLPKEYVFKTHYSAISDNTDIAPEFTFTSATSGVIVADKLTLDRGGDANAAYIHTAKTVYPFSITPTFMAMDSSSAIADNGEREFVFTNKDSVHKFTVEAADGKSKEWELRVMDAPVVNHNSEDADKTMLQPTDLTYVSVSAISKGFSIEEHDFRASSPEEGIPSDTLVVYIASYGASAFPATIAVKPGSGSDVATIGLPDEMVFADLDEAKDFYQIDIANNVARHWFVKLERYVSPYLSVESVSFTYTPSMINPYFDPSKPNPSPAGVLDTDNIDIDRLGRKIYLHLTDVSQPLSASTWKIDAVVRIGLTNGMLMDVNASWVGYTTRLNPYKFNIVEPSGDTQAWEMSLQEWVNGEPVRSGDCELTDVSIMELRPFVARVNEIEPLTIDAANRTIAINLAKDDNAYPMSVIFNYTVSAGAKIGTQNGGTEPIVFNTVNDTATVEIVSENGANTAQWTVSLVAPPREAGADVTQMQIVSFSPPSTAAVINSIDPDNAVINMAFTTLSDFPVTMDFRMGLSYMATCDILDANGYGSFTFNNIEDKTFTVVAQNGVTKQWTLRVEDFNQQDFWQFESWIDDYTPSPKGIKGSPGWASANMNYVVDIKNTYKTAGDAGQGSAVMLETVDAVVKKASGSLFLGWFDSANAIAGLSDPVILTFQGVPFFSTKRIVGMEADIWYSPGAGAGSDTGTLAIELINWRNTSGDFVYHGKRPDGTVHPDNNADMVARGRVLVGTQNGTQNGETIKVVPDGQWVKKVYVPLEYSGAYPQYTHLGITFASSSQGDLFIAEPGTKMKVDNVRLVYE